VESARELYEAFVRDLFVRVEKLKKVQVTVFVGGGDPASLRALAPDRFRLVAQEGDGLGERMGNAFRHLIEGDGVTAVVIGSDSPDVPLVFVKRAFLKLKHRDVVLGPASDGGYYLIGLKQSHPELFQGPAWGTAHVLTETLEIARDHTLSCSLLPLWYDVDDIHGLGLLRAMLLGRRIERRDRLRHTERIIEQLFPGEGR
jgi:rSAM/selenodomain-associated transferase 1